MISIIILSVLLVFLVVIRLSLRNFKMQVSQERKIILSENVMTEQIVTEDMIKDLPVPIKRWLIYSGIIGRKKLRQSI